MMEMPLGDGLSSTGSPSLVSARILVGVGCAQGPIHKFTYFKIPPVTPKPPKSNLQLPGSQHNPMFSGLAARIIWEGRVLDS